MINDGWLVADSQLLITHHQLLYFYINLPFVELVADAPVYADEQQRIGQ